jgi:RNA polymerase sigma-70 factor (ECF subfamily)
MSANDVALTRRYNFEFPDSDSQRRLVQLAKNGDANAFGLLYDGYIERIYRYIYFRVTDDETAEDLTSQVFSKAWENLDRYKPSGAPFIAWLYTIARNAVIDHFRTRKETVALDEVASLSSSGPSPDEVVELHFETEALRDALQSLTDEQQQVVVLKFIAGMATDEIAKQLGKRPSAIRALQMRGLQALARQMEKKEVV